MITTGIVGATGYTGAELLRLLARHPGVRVAAVTSRQAAGRAVAEVFPALRGVLDARFVSPDEAPLTECDVVFFATPNGTAMRTAPRLLDAGVRVIDLSADFRLRDAALWEAWYGMPHAAPQLLPEAVYGLPELNRDAITRARLVANPGCYPTAVSLALVPLLEAGAVATAGLVADAKSGVTGAGRRAEEAYLYAELAEGFKAYGVAGHRHHPEIVQTLSTVAASPVELTFVPHLVPMLRGIHATVYATPVDDGADLQALFERRYAREPFVDVLPAGRCPDTRSVRGANTCRVAVVRPRAGGRVVVLSVIDNLVKGAAGQAVQNMNLMCGLAEATGLDVVPLSP